MIDSRREFLRKEKENADINYQVTTKYQQECKSTKRWVLPKELIEQYMACTDKTSFLQQYGNEVDL